MDLAYMAALPPMEFVERRQRLLAFMPDNSALLLFSAEEKSVTVIANIRFVKIAIFGI